MTNKLEEEKQEIIRLYNNNKYDYKKQVRLSKNNKLSKLVKEKNRFSVKICIALNNLSIQKFQIETILKNLYGNY